LIAKLEENRMWLDRQQVLVNVIREEPSNWYNTALVYAPVSYGWVIENIEIALRASDRDTQYALMNSDISNADAYAQTAAEAASAALELTINLPPQISALQAEVAAAFANGSDEYHHILADATSSTYLAPPSIGALSY